MKPEDVRAEELTLKMLGLVPADFDLRKNTLDLLTEQAAAFYDYNQKKLFVLEGWRASAAGRRGARRAGSRTGARAGRSAFSPGEIHPRRDAERR